MTYDECVLPRWQIVPVSKGFDKSAACRSADLTLLHSKHYVTNTVGPTGVLYIDNINQYCKCRSAGLILNTLSPAVKSRGVSISIKTY